MTYIYISIALGILTVLAELLKMPLKAKRGLVKDLKKNPTVRTEIFILTLATILFLWPFKWCKDIKDFASRLHLD